MNQIVAFDFDGTITKKDTLLEFIKFTKGKAAFFKGFLLYSPWLIAYKLKLYPNWKAKQKVFTHFFTGMDKSDFDTLCENFYLKKGKELVRSDAYKCISEYIEKGSIIVIISASIENWVLPFAKALGIFHILCTEIKTDSNGKLTGNFQTANCYGQEKVNRLLSLFPCRESYELIAYGDSHGDKKLLAFADKGYYKKFCL